MGRRILLADGNQAARAGIVHLLEDLGHEVISAQDGDEALRLAETSSPEVVILDLGVPGLEGLGVARALRSGPRGGELILIALAGWGQEHHREATRQAGFDMHLVRPLAIDQLTFVLSMNCDTI
jgi:two-component system CheB/CheR fusion protein